MNITLSVDDEIVRAARRRADALGASVNRLVRNYLKELSGDAGSEADAAEFERLSRASRGNSRGWKFNRDEIHQPRTRERGCPASRSSIPTSCSTPTMRRRPGSNRVRFL